jgi:hypothetical protein
VLTQAFEKFVANGRLRGFAEPTLAAGSLGQMQFLRGEIRLEMSKIKMQITQLLNTAMANMQAEADRRVEDALQRIMEMLEKGPKQNEERTVPSARTDARTEHATQDIGRQVLSPGQAAQPSWASITGASKGSGWTTVANGKRKPKKHPLDQRRILFARNVQSHSCDPRDIMFEANKALANARAHVTVRLIKMRYTEKGNLTGVVSQHACADELLNYATVLMAAVKKLDPEVVLVEKTEKWRKLRVHGVALDRYTAEGGLKLAREEIELMTGEQLPYPPRWLKGDSLGERFDSGSIKRSTLVLTVKSKQAADVILARGLSFGGRRHEVERFWERGEGRMCTRCCGRDHLGKCTEEARCFVCAGEHTGSEHHCSAEGCGRRSEPCEHHMAKCANCDGPHMATSRKCPERKSHRQTRAPKPTEIRSSPPVMETEQEQDELTVQEDEAEMEVETTPIDQGQTGTVQVTTISSDASKDQPPSQGQGLPRPTRELRSMTKSFLGATQNFPSPDDETSMLIDDDSAST